MKKCSMCNIPKELENFSSSKKSKDGHKTRCKKCDSIKNKLYYKNNIEKIKKRLLNNKLKIKKSRAEYYLNNKDKIKKKIDEYVNNISLYETYKDKLTIDESPRLSKDGVSLEVKCRYCGRYFKPTNGQVKHRIQGLNGTTTGEQGLYCSDGCKSECPIFGQILHQKGNKKATSREVQPQLRQLVLERDNYTCQYCGSTEYLHCHHIYPLNESPITSADIDECITLCIDCHKEVHMNVSGCGYHEMKCSEKRK